MADQIQTSALKRKETIFRNTFTLALLGGAGAVAAFFILPYIAIILTNLLYCGLLALGVAGLGYMVMDKQIRTIVWVYYRSFTHWLADKSISIDPIGILQNRVEDGRDRSEHFGEQIDNLSGQLKNVANQIKQYNKEAQEALEQARVAKNHPDQEANFMLQSRQYDRLQESSKQLQEMHDRMQSVLATLKKAKQITDVIVTDTENTVKVQRKQRDMMKAGWSAYQEAQALMSGETTEREMFDLAMEKLAVDYDTKMAAIENFAEESKGLFQNFDLKNEVAASQMLARIQELEKKGGLIETQPPRVALRVDTNVVAPPGGFDDLFNSSNSTSGKTAQR